MRAKVVWSSANDSKEKLVVTAAIRGDKEWEIGENNVEAQEDMQNRTGTEPIQKRTVTHIAQNEEDKGRGEENSELLISYDNIDTVEKQTILEKIVELINKGNLPNPQKPKKNW